MGLEPEDLEVIAQEEFITIVPNFHQETIRLVNCVVGPFHAALPSDVPIWLAIHWKKATKCRILIPTWLTVENLDVMLHNERNIEDCTIMPSAHYVEIANIVMEHSFADFPDIRKLKVLLEQIWNVRSNKIMKSFDFEQDNMDSALEKNITQMEIVSTRLFNSTVQELCDDFAANMENRKYNEIDDLEDDPDGFTRNDLYIM